MDEIDAQRTISKMYRGKKQRDEYRDLRDEEARQQWVDYYVHTGQLDAARELGWDGEPVGDAEAAPPSEDAEAQEQRAAADGEEPGRREVRPVMARL